MNFDQIVTFLTIAKMSSYSRAAEDLNVTQPAVTARITSLEEELECKLFNTEKSTRPVLTKEGELFFNYANKVVNELYETKKAITLSKKPILRFGFTPNFSPDIIAEITKSFDVNAANILLRRGTSSEKLAESTQHRELLLSFVYNPVREPQLIVEDVARLKLEFVISRDHPLAKKEHISIDELMNGTLVSYFRLNTLWLNIDEKLKPLNLNLIEGYDIELVKKIVSDKLGFAILPELTLSKIDVDYLCVKPFELLEEITIDFCAIYHKDVEEDSQLYPIVRSTIDQMKQIVRRDKQVHRLL